MVDWPEGMSERERVESIARTTTQPRSAAWIAEAAGVDPAFTEDVLSSLVEDERAFIETSEGYGLDSDRLREEKRDRFEEMPNEELREELERIKRENEEWRDKYGVDSPDGLLAQEYSSPEAAEDAYDWQHNLYVRGLIEDVLGE